MRGERQDCLSSARGQLGERKSGDLTLRISMTDAEMAREQPSESLSVSAYPYVIFPKSKGIQIER